MCKSRITTTLLVLGWIAAAAIAPASALASLGFLEVNGTDAASAPAFPGEAAAWAGTCNLGEPSTADGGIGTVPAAPLHCIDLGTYPSLYYRPSSGDLWGSGESPSWRLNPVVQAGARPDASVSMYFSLTQEGALGGNVRDVIVHLPPGVVGNPTAVPKCSAEDAQYIPPRCPASTQVGVATVDQDILAGIQQNRNTYPIYNVVPRGGVTAEFVIGDVAELFNVPVTARARTNGDYGIDALSLEIPTYAPLYGLTTTFWSVPWTQEHDPFRLEGNYIGEERGGTTVERIGEGLPPAAQSPYQQSWGPIRPFFTNPTRCTTTPLTVGLEIDSWQNPGATLSEGVPAPGDSHWKAADVEQPLVTGCEKPRFDPTIALQPTVASSDSPTGLNVKLATPQNNELPFSPPAEGASTAEVEAYAEEASEYWQHNEAGFASSQLKDATVALPKGLDLNAAAANGLGACTTKEIGLTTTEGEDPTPIRFNNSWPLGCPDSSKIGTMKVTTPLLSEPLEGDVYLASQGDNPFGSLFAIYLVAHSEARGLTAKIAGEVRADPTTGQLTAVFKNNPQIPLETIELHFKGGARAPLSTPQTCGTYASSATLTSWARPQEGVSLESPFDVNQGPAGSGCPDGEAGEPNAPSFQAGTQATAAGSYSPFVLHLAREDGSQRLSAVDVTLPEGLTGKLAGIAKCTEAQIAAAQARSKAGEGAIEQTNPSCPSSSQVGVVHVAAGSGAEPYFVTGRAYLAGAYKGAPFSLVFITPAVAGPFDLGTVVLRAGLYIDPHTAQVTVKSDPLPTILEGVPLDIRTINVDVDRQEFTLNPTSCQAMRITGSATSTQGQAAPLSDRFQVGGCKSLPFKPTFKVSTKAHHTRRGGAYLRVGIESKQGQANIHMVHVALPIKLPARNSTLKLACTEEQFAANPAGCPEGSLVGTAEAHTPLLASPLKGPAIYVSHGGRSFPDLDIVLQGEGVTIDLTGNTFISKKGVTTSTFASVPDVPVNSFSLTLPEGQHSALAGFGNFCTRTVVKKKRVPLRHKGHVVRRKGHVVYRKLHRKGHVVRRHGKVVFKKRKVRRKVKRKLFMPTTITGQNGAVVEQATRIKVQGCAAGKGKGKHQDKRGHGKHHGKGKAGKAKAAHRHHRH